VNYSPQNTHQPNVDHFDRRDEQLCLQSDSDTGFWCIHTHGSHCIAKDSPLCFFFSRHVSIGNAPLSPSLSQPNFATANFQIKETAKDHKHEISRCPLDQPDNKVRKTVQSAQEET